MIHYLEKGYITEIIEEETNSCNEDEQLEFLSVYINIINKEDKYRPA